MKKAPAKKSNKGRRSKKGPYQTGKTDIKVDRTKKAMKPGKRKSKNGGTYYEYRANRSDMPGSLTGYNNFIKKKNKIKKEDLFYSVLKQLDLPGAYFNVYGKTFAKFYANVKTIDGTDKKTISKKALDFFKKIQDTPLKLSVKPVGKKTKNIEFIDDEYVKTTWQLHEYKISI